jgi:hypothetical protein
MNHRSSCRLTAILLAHLLLLLGALAAYGQEEAPIPPFFLMVEHNVQPEKIAQYTASVTKIVEAFKQTEGAQEFAAFSNFTGSDDVFRYFVPAQQMGDMDSWLQVPQIVAGVHGAEAEKILANVSAAATMKSTLLAYLPELSNPPSAESPGPPQFAFHFHSRVKGDNASEYAGLLGQFVAAYKGTDKQPSWVTFTNQIGGKGAEYHVFLGMQRMGDFDSWTPPPVALTEKYGAEETAKMMQRMSEISEGGSELLVLVPGLSNIATE